jgi:TnpA family transposase
MTYLLTWELSAILELGRIERTANDPASVRKASEWIDYTRCRIPLNVGESRFGNYRLWYSDVLGVYYEVDTDAMTVKVLAVEPAIRG